MRHARSWHASLGVEGRRRTRQDSRQGSYREKTGGNADPFAGSMHDVAVLEAAARHQRLAVREGDILLVHTAWGGLLSSSNLMLKPERMSSAGTGSDWTRPLPSSSGTTRFALVVSDKSRSGKRSWFAGDCIAAPSPDAGPRCAPHGATRSGISGPGMQGDRPMGIPVRIGSHEPDGCREASCR